MDSTNPFSGTSSGTSLKPGPISKLPGQPSASTSFLNNLSLNGFKDWLILLALVLGIAWLGSSLLGRFVSPALDQRLFVGSMTLDQAGAQALYAESQEALTQKQPEVALAGFDKLEKQYPGLRELILLHQAEAKAQVPDEAGAQKALNALIRDYPNSPLVWKARYELGQSQIRASQVAEAKATFEQLNAQIKDKPYGQGALYYLGVLAKDKDPQKAIAYWQDYLNACPDCLFSGDSASELDTLLSSRTYTPEQHRLIGRAYALSDRQWGKALTHLNQADQKETLWYELGLAYLNNRQIELARQSWIAGLNRCNDSDRLVEVVDRLLKLGNASATLEALKSVTAPGADYIWWKLAQNNPSQKNTYYQELVNRFPSGDYAPESSWNLISPYLTSGQKDIFVQKAQVHVQKFPYARSASKALFWVAKFVETSHPADAIKAYEKIVSDYPDSYYAFRATGRLKKIRDGQTDPGWTTQPNRANYLNIDPLKKLKNAELAPAITDARVNQAVKELMVIGASDDVRLLSKESLGEVPPLIESWCAHLEGDRPLAMRTMRDALMKQGVKLKKPISPSKAELTLLYPLYFNDAVLPNANKNRIDPFLVQALMREESYFNELAVSSSNARGLMQLLPSTAGDVAQWEKMSGFNTFSLFEPSVNIRLGSRYLGYLHQTFSSQPAHKISMPSVGAYNGGPGAMGRWVKSIPSFESDPDLFVEQIPYQEAREYIKKVFGSYWNYTRLYGES